MDLITLLMLVGLGAYILKTHEQKRRISLLGSHLVKHKLEKRMENLTEGYLRALGETDPERREQVWTMLSVDEVALCEQFKRFTTEIAREDAVNVRVSKLPLAVPFVDKLFPAMTFDLRKALSIHAQGITHAAHNVQIQSQKDKAFTMTAELLLMQHTCHWYCRSKTVASARMLARHRTPYAQLLASVAPATRKSYLELVGA
jgi:hypothetical protein